MVLKVFKNEFLEMIELKTFFFYFCRGIQTSESQMIRSHLFKIKNFKKYIFRMTETEKWNRLKNQLQTLKFAEVEQNQLRIGLTHYW